MKNRRNYYRILHVGPDAPYEVIRASYRTLMQRLSMHPDLGGDPAQAALMNEAYATLSDPSRRAAYDRTLEGPEAARRDTSGAERPGPGASRRTTSPSWRDGGCCFCGAPGPARTAARPDSTCSECGSALCPPPTIDAGAASRRATERLQRDMRVTIRRAETPQHRWSATTCDVSLNGMGLRTAVHLSVGERIRIENDFCSAVAVVRTAGRRNGRRVYGVEFLTLRLKQERGGFVSTVA